MLSSGKKRLEKGQQCSGLKVLMKGTTIRGETIFYYCFCLFKHTCENGHICVNSSKHKEEESCFEPGLSKRRNG